MLRVWVSLDRLKGWKILELTLLGKEVRAGSSAGNLAEMSKASSLCLECGGTLVNSPIKPT